MALTKSTLHFRRFLSPIPPRILKPYSFSSASEAHLQETDTADDDSQTAPVPYLSADETLIADKFHSLIKDHHRNNPNPNPNPHPPSISLKLTLYCTLAWLMAGAELVISRRRRGYFGT
ncbi:hypothetical protein EV2_043535 [Malus domestica]